MSMSLMIALYCVRYPGVILLVWRTCVLLGEGRGLDPAAEITGQHSSSIL